MIAIVDYGLGNVLAIRNVYRELGISAEIITDRDGLHRSDKVIVPGVGAFDQAVLRLERSGLRSALDDMVLRNGTPILGICVGMQMLARKSEEGRLRGLGWIDAEVKRFDLASSREAARIPHMGWNNVRPVKESLLLSRLDKQSRFYFLHSYYMQCTNAEDVLCVTDYGGEFTCVVNSKNIYGVQFHPEKSHGFGIQLLKNFAEL